MLTWCFSIYFRLAVDYYTAMHLLFSIDRIPDTGAEADMEYFELVEPKDIPLTDVSHRLT